MSAKHSRNARQAARHRAARASVSPATIAAAGALGIALTGFAAGSASASEGSATKTNFTQDIGDGKTSPGQQATKIWQELLNEHGADLTVSGTYDARTKQAARAFQAANKLPVTGEMDQGTARVLLARTIRREAKAVGEPADILCGHLTMESGLNPSAVGPSGADLGIAQIVPKYNPEVTVAQAWDEDTAIRQMARRDAKAFKKYGVWKYAVTDYFNPKWTAEWVKTGEVKRGLDYYPAVVMSSCRLPASVMDLPGGKTHASRSETREAPKTKAAPATESAHKAGSKPTTPATSQPKATVHDHGKTVVVPRKVTKSATPKRTTVTPNQTTSKPSSPKQSMPTMTAVPKSSSSVGAHTHTVKSGDTLWGIAVTHYGHGTDASAGLRWKDIASLNGMTGTIIRPGQVLKLPTS